MGVPLVGPLGVLVLVVVGAAGFRGEGARPNILHILVDDYGWADAGWHRPKGYAEVQTPNLDGLVAEGVELDRHYVFKFCSPTRSAVQSGRNPIHVNVLNLAPNVANPEDQVSGYAAVPRNMTGMAEHMARAGYETHMYGKWDAGMATPQHTPHGRGYQKSMLYFHHDNDYWTSRVGMCSKEPVVDLWEDDAPAHGRNNSPSCSQTAQAGCVYEDQLFADRVYEAIESHSGKPLFIFWAPHIVHTPLEVPQRFLDKFAFIDDSDRRFYHAMVNFVDEAIGNATKLLKAKGLWNNTLIVVHADNGGPIYFGGGANNYPLRGGKMSNWEGGIRVNAFATGGFLPEEVRGTKNEGYVCGWDWYATYAALAGVDPTDHKAAKAGLPPIDSLNMWPFISGQVKASPRTEIPIGDSNGEQTVVGGLISGDYKILVGHLGENTWTGPQYPNVSSHVNPPSLTTDCGETAATGCLFNIREDPTEHNNLAPTNADVFATMLKKLKAVSVFSPNRGKIDPKACEKAMGEYKGFWGPWLHL